MGYLSTEREAIASAVGEALGIQSHAYLPGRIVPPCALVLAGSPYIDRQDSDAFGHGTAHWEVWLIAAKGSNDVETAELDGQIETATEALTSEGFAVDQVAEPFIYQVQSANYLTATILTSTGVTFTNN